MSRTVAEVIADTLEKAGVRTCYGIPGDTLNYFTEAVRKSAMRWIHVRHEEAGAFAAGAEAFVTDGITACAGSCGPGSLHFINGIYEAYRNGAPVVLICSQIVQDQLCSDFPQEVDFQAIYASCSVYCDRITTPAQAERKTALAVQAALNRRGVAVLIVPVDVSKQEVPETGGIGIAPRRSRPALTPDPADVEAIAALLNASPRVTIYGGIGCAGVPAKVMELARRLAAPVARTSRAKDFLEPGNPHDVGMIGMFGHESALHAVNTCETMLILGADFAWAQFYPDKADIIQVDRDPMHLGRRHPIRYGAVADVGAMIDALLPRLNRKDDTAFLDDCRKRYAGAVADYDERAVADGDGPLHPQYIVRLVDRMAADDALFTADVGSPMVWMLRHITANGKRRTLTSLRHGTMANAMPQALGLQAAYPERQVVSFSGDGGLAMLLGDMLTAVQENLPIKVVVLNNSSLFFVELEQRMEGLLDTYTNLRNPDFAEVARAMGFWGRRLEKSADAETAVAAFLAHEGPALLDVVVDREIVMPPHVGFSQVKGMALYSIKALFGGRAGDLKTMIRENT